MVDQGWRKGGLRVDKGWTTLTLYGDFMADLQPYFLNVWINISEKWKEE